jgi:hypothetical protein
MKLCLLLYTLPVIMAEFVLVIHAPVELVDNITILGKQESEGDQVVMTRAKNDPTSMEYCFTLNGDFTYATSEHCHSQPAYADLTQIHFENPTNDPRPLEITLPARKLKASSISQLKQR